MINMMYLVLTAMLALNVSAEVLLAFVKIEQGLDQTVEITRRKNLLTVEDFETTAADERKDLKPDEVGKVGPWADKAKLVREHTEAFVEYVQALKIDLVRKADGAEALGVSGNKIIADSIEALDNTAAGDELMLGVAKNGRAYDLRKKIEEYKAFLVENVITDSSGRTDEGLKNEVNDLLSFHIDKKALSDGRNWEEFTFESTPLIANVATLTKIQVNALSTETSVLNYLRSQIGRTDFKISNIEAAVNNPEGTLVKGGTSKAEVFLMAYDANMKSRVKIGGRDIPVVNGKAEVTLSGSTLGNQRVTGSIYFNGPSGAEESREFSIEYQVVEPSLVVSATYMNVFYQGVENPIDVSVTGVPMGKIKVSVTNASITGSGGIRQVIPTTTGKCIVNVSAEINGVNKNLEGKEFRVKRLPTPTPTVYGINGKSATKGQLASAQGVIAKMPEDFDFKYPIKVTGFTVSLVQGGFLEEARSESDKFTEKQRSLISGIRGSSRVMITDIKASGPAGTVDLPDLVYKVQ